MASKKKKTSKKAKIQPKQPIFLGPEPGGVTSIGALGANLVACTASGELFLLNRNEQGGLKWFALPGPTAQDRASRA